MDSDWENLRHLGSFMKGDQDTHVCCYGLKLHLCGRHYKCVLMGTHVHFSARSQLGTLFC